MSKHSENANHNLVPSNVLFSPTKKKRTLKREEKLKSIQLRLEPENMQHFLTIYA